MAGTGIGGMMAPNPSYYASITFPAAPAASDYVVIGDAHYDGSNTANFLPLSPYNVIQNPMGFSTVYATGATTAIQTYGQFVGQPIVDYASFGYDLRNVSALNPINAVSDGSLTTGNVTVTLTTTVPNCYAVVFLYSTDMDPTASVIVPAGLTEDFTGFNSAFTSLITYHSTTPLPVGTTTYTFVETAPIGLLAQGTAFAP
jgi:hypothetical protein